jgi:hypothetical protein
MSFGYKTVKDAIVTTLQGVTSLKIVYGKEEKAIKKFPAACVSAKEHNNIYNDLAGNSRSVVHYIRLYFRTDETNDPDYEDILESVADEVINALEHDVTLGGACEFTKPTNGVWGNADKEVPVRMLEITLESRKREVR